MKSWIRDIFLVSTGFAAGAFFMHCAMHKKYQAFADEQIADVREHYKKREQTMDERVKEEAQKKAVELISGPYRQVDDPEKPDSRRWSQSRLSSRMSSVRMTTTKAAS